MQYNKFAYSYMISNAQIYFNTFSHGNMQPNIYLTT